MTLDDFRASLAGRDPPAGVPPPLVGLWHDARGDWDRAHRAVMEAEGPAAAWVHAYLHRKEGDLANAGYWYRLAQRRPAEGPLEAEWEAIARSLLASEPR
jgi:hypothetical protein